MDLEKVYNIHKSVLQKECLAFLSENFSQESRGWFADLTFGAGGHSIAFLKNFHEANLIAVDQDIDAVKNGYMKIEEEGLQSRLHLHHTNFVDFPKLIAEKYQFIIDEYKGFAGILLDLGVSSHQFDCASRGFSFRKEGNLDMRMNQSDDMVETAADLVNNLSKSELEDVIKTYGEERFAKKIAGRIVDARLEKPIQTTKELENIIFHSYPAKLRNGRIHPATRTFQALRLAVNQELKVLSDVLPLLAKMLSDGGRLMVISFHSLEDRIVKHTFRNIAPKGGEYNILTKRPITPSDNEIKENFRARSAKMRVLQKN